MNFANNVIIRDASGIFRSKREVIDLGSTGYLLPIQCAISLVRFSESEVMASGNRREIPWLPSIILSEVSL